MSSGQRNVEYTVAPEPYLTHEVRDHGLRQLTLNATRTDGNIEEVRFNTGTSRSMVFHCAIRTPRGWHMSQNVRGGDDQGELLILDQVMNLSNMPTRRTHTRLPTPFIWEDFLDRTNFAAAT